MKDISSELIIKIKQLSAEKINKQSTEEENLNKIKDILNENNLNYIFDILLEHKNENEPFYITLENILFSEMYKYAVKEDYEIKKHEAIMYLAFTLETNEILLNKIYFNNDYNNDLKKIFFENVKTLLNLYNIEENKIKNVLNLLNNEENIRYVIKKELL